jgi:hypothetical protein
MYKIADLVKTIRNLDKNKGIITIEEAQRRADAYKSIQQLTISGDNTKGYCISKAVVFIDDYMFGYKVLPKEWVPSSTRLPVCVVPRPELPSGLITNVEDYMKVFHDEETVVLQTMEDFVEYLNKENDKK